MTAASLPETRPIILKTCCMASDRPTMSSRCCSTVSCGLKALALRSSAAALRAESTTTLRLNGSCSLRTKSKAPIFIASMTDCVVPERACDDHHRIRRVLADPRQKLQPGERVKVHLGQNKLRLLHAKRLVGRIGGCLKQDAGGRALQLVLRPVEEVGFAVNEKNCLLFRHC